MSQKSGVRSTDAGGKRRMNVLLGDREYIFDGDEIATASLDAGVPNALRLIEPIVHTVSVTPGTVEIGDIFTILYNGTAVAAYTAAAATVADVVTGLVAAWAAGKASVAGASRITATDDTTKVTLTYDTAGVEFVALITGTAVDGGIADTQTIGIAAVLNNDTDTLESSPKHILGSNSISFDKINGSNNLKNAGFELSGLAINLSRFLADAVIHLGILVPDLTNVAKLYIRLGDDASNYSQWTIDDTALAGVAWELQSVALSTVDTTVVGTGADMDDINYAAVLLEFDLETNALDDILVDHLLIHGHE